MKDGDKMQETFTIAGYCRISVDDELDRDNTSIENQKLIIEDFVKRKFPGSELKFYEDRDRSGYTFEQREGYQELRPLLMSRRVDILVVKDFSRFSRRNSRGLVELEDLRDAGARIISIGDSIDYPTYDDWTAIQFRFLVNELPVTDTSKKVKSVIKRRQNEGKWICSVPYGYVITNSKTMQFKVDEPAAEVVREIFRLYIDGWGYKRIANHLTDKHIPTPRMCEKERKESKGEECKLTAKPEWSIITIQTILQNDFYIGTLRQAKYRRRSINGKDMKNDEDEHIVFEKNHEPIVDYRIFAQTQELMKKRSKSNYRGVKKFDNVYSGYLYCGDCGSPMFSMSRADLAPAYTCGTYHKRGLKGCTSHHIRCDLLDELLKSYVRRVRDNSSEMLAELDRSLKNETSELKNSDETIDILKRQIDEAREELKATKRQKIRELMKKPEQSELLEETFTELEDELELRIAGLENQLALSADKRNTMVKVNRIARTALDIFDDILSKEKLDKCDLDILIDRIDVFSDRVNIHLKADIDSLLQCGEAVAVNFNSGSMERPLLQRSRNGTEKVYTVNVVSGVDPLEIYTSNDGEVIFKKYSAINEMAGSAAQVAEVMTKLANCPTVVFDRDHVVAVAGVQKKEFNERRVSQALEEYLESRKNYLYTSHNDAKVFPVEGIDRPAIACSPILASGDVTGAVAFLAPNNEAVASEVQQNLIQAAAQFLGKQIEE